MQPPILISPSILSANLLCLKNEICLLEQSGADWIHVDIMDGHFVPNLTMGPMIINKMHTITNCKIDVHLMVSNPVYYVDDLAQLGAHYITLHCESDPENVEKNLQYIRKKGCKPGLAIKPQTPIQSILRYIEWANLILVMSVEPGYGGQKFMDSSLDKVEFLSSYIRSKRLNCLISVDGGIDDNTSILVRQKGAHVLVSGNFIFKHQDYKIAIQQLR